MPIINDTDIDRVIFELKNGNTVSYSLGLTITTIQFDDEGFINLLLDQRDRMEFKTILSEEDLREKIKADQHGAFAMFLDMLKERRD